ncbi:MAG: trypsin-like peptidase domain-containing protein [Rhodospirillales bacterium]
MIPLTAIARWAAFAFSVAVLMTGQAEAEHAETAWAKASPSVVSVLPTWPGYDKPGFGAPIGTAPEGSGVAVLEPGLILTAAHVVVKATSVQVRDSKGSIYDAEILAIDGAADLALLRTPVPVPPIVLAVDRPSPGVHACIIANAFGLGLSITCGVVSAERQSGIGFNPLEDFIQTDAAANPGSSGGALVNDEGELTGLLSAIFTKESDANAGVNFAASADLLRERLPRLMKRAGLTD